GDYTVALLASEVEDTSGNAVAADPSLEVFTVDLSSAPPAPFRVEAETFNIVSGFNIKSNAVASGGQYLQAGGSGEQRASYTFTEATGVYDLGLGYFDESDGQSQMSVLVNGVEIDNFIWNVDAGEALANPTSFVERTISDVSLTSGDVIEIVGFKDGSEPLRTDYFDFTYVDDQIA
ncbi:hypothetical protein, partial [Ruegeria atlantica]|uniref:hypothetical protein n=1 Tax=Ruegeria atlantica TaxID=81569 RepID=UPI001C2C07B7